MRAFLLAALVGSLVITGRAQAPIDKAARQWVDATLKKMSLEQIVGQMIFAPFDSTYLSSDTDDYDELVKLVHETQIGGVIAFGGNERVPQVMLNNTYGNVVLGQPLELASILNRLQSISTLPLLTSSDFEWGVQMRIAGATKFPARDGVRRHRRSAARLSRPARSSAPNRARSACTSTSRPVADVNNNPRNPVINIRSFGENPARAGEMVSGFARGLQDAGMLAMLKHFPGHGDTDVDSHLGLPIVPHAARAPRCGGARAVQGRHRRRRRRRDGWRTSSCRRSIRRSSRRRSVRR